MGGGARGVELRESAARGRDELLRSGLDVARRGHRARCDRERHVSGSAHLRRRSSHRGRWRLRRLFPVVARHARFRRRRALPQPRRDGARSAPAGEESRRSRQDQRRQPGAGAAARRRTVSFRRGDAGRRQHGARARAQDDDPRALSRDGPRGGARRHRLGDPCVVPARRRTSDSCAIPARRSARRSRSRRTSSSGAGTSASIPTTSK